MIRSLATILLPLSWLSGVCSAQEIDLPARAIAFSADGQWLAVGRGSLEGKQGDVTVWSLPERKAVFTQTSKRGIPSVAFAADGKLLAVASYDNIAKLLDVPSGTLRAEFAHLDGVRALDLSGDGNTLVTVCRDHKYRVWDVRTGKENLSLPTKEIPACVSIHPDGGTFLLIQPGGTAVIDRTTGKPRFQLDQGPGSNVYFALYSGDGRWIFTSDNHARVRIWNAIDGSPRATLRNASGYRGLAYAPATGMLATATGWSRSAHTLRIALDNPSDKDKEEIESLLAQLDDDAIDVRNKASQRLLQLSLLAAGDLQKAAEHYSSAEVRMRARWIHEQVVQSRFADFPSLPSRPDALAFSPDGRLLACGCADGATYLWDVEQKRDITRLRPETHK